MEQDRDERRKDERRQAERRKDDRRQAERRADAEPPMEEDVAPNGAASNGHAPDRERQFEQARETVTARAALDAERAERNAARKLFRRRKS